MSKWRVFLFLSLCVLVPPTWTWAQETPTAIPETPTAIPESPTSTPQPLVDLRIVVLDSSTTLPIANALVRIGPLLFEQTNSLGLAVFTQIQPGSVEVNITKIGYESLSFSLQIVQGMQPVTAHLSPRGGAETPTETPTVQPETPTETPTVRPTESPTVRPTESPTVRPTESPTVRPTETPTVRPTESPTVRPTESPTVRPTESPTMRPTESPTVRPTESPTVRPTESPTVRPTESPTVRPTESPTIRPTLTPTPRPTESPTARPTRVPPREPLNMEVQVTKGGRVIAVNPSAIILRVGDSISLRITVNDPDGGVIALNGTVHIPGLPGIGGKPEVAPRNFNLPLDIVERRAGHVVATGSYTVNAQDIERSPWLVFNSTSVSTSGTKTAGQRIKIA
ncbi:MAG TPA: hypothetical protein PLY86_19405, partial [bacterium]|nr:hypothetical protein [bacterium]